jgi:hypothetical protein
MASASAVRWREKFGEVGSENAASLLIVVSLLCAAGLLGVIALSSDLKTFGVVGGAVFAIVLAFASGNPRLCCLWGFAVTLSLSLGKRFGPMFLGKVGGEDSFRIELSDLFLFALFGFIVWELMTGRRKGLRVPKVTFIWLLLVAIGCVWMVIGPWHLTAAHEIFRMLKVTLLLIIIANELNRPRRIWHCVAALSLAAIGQSVVALVQYRMKGLIGLQILGETSSRTIDVLQKTSVLGAEVFRPSGLLEHANLLGVFLVASISLSVAMLLVTRHPIARLFFLVTIALAIPAEIVAMSRSAWVSAAISLTLMLMMMCLHPRLRSRSIITSCVAGIIGLVILGAFFGPITDRLLHSKDDATKAREIYKADARRMIAAAPWVGHGLNSYTFELPNYSTLAIKSYGDAPPAVHNIFYLWWAETGIVGLFIFCMVWASIIWTGFTNLSVRDELLFVVNAASLATMIALIPDSFLSFTLRVNTTLRLFWFLAALIMAVRYLRIQEQKGSEPRRSRASTAPAIFEPELASP